MLNRPQAQWNIAQAAMTFVAFTGRRRADAAPRAPVCALGVMAVLALAGCATGPLPEKPLPFYRCEYGIEFTAKFTADTVTLDSSRGYDLLFRDSKPVGSPNPNPIDYSNPRMSATFNLGAAGQEAVLRYPLLPLVARCARG
jgi:hypothetical protein